MREDGTAAQALRNGAQKKATKHRGETFCAHEDEATPARRCHFVSRSDEQRQSVPQKSLRPRTEKGRVHPASSSVVVASPQPLGSGEILLSASA
jgi:hypothetical protein